jgi:error-prone DNA polymerase
MARRLLERNDERHLRSTEEMVELFSDLPEATGNTGELSARLEYTLVDLGCEFPRYPVTEGETMDSFLRKRTEEGFQNRYGAKRNEELFERAQKAGATGIGDLVYRLSGAEKENFEPPNMRIGSPAFSYV